MSAAEAQKPVTVPAIVHVEPVAAPVTAEPTPAPAAVPAAADPVVPKLEAEPELPATTAAAPVQETKGEAESEDKAVEPVYSGLLNYKAPGLKNAFRFSKKHFWFGEEPVPAYNLNQYLRGEKPELAHPVVAWSSQTGKGLLFFAKHVEQKENPAGVLSLAYATDLVKDGLLAFTLKISGSKHAFEATSASERDGWFVAMEKSIADAKEAKEGIEASEGYKEHKEKISKPTAIAAASSATTKTSEGETVAEPSTAPPARTDSSSGSSADEDKKHKKKSKSRSLSRGKRASIFGGLLGKKEKESKEGDAVKATEAEAAKEEPAIAAPTSEPSATAPVITTDIPKPSEELKTEVADASVLAAAPSAPAEEIKKEETPAKAVEEKPKPVKRGSFFGAFVEKLKSPRDEKKEHDFPAPSAVKEVEATPEVIKPTEEAPVAEPITTDAPAQPILPEVSAEPSTTKAEEIKPVAAGTPSKEKEHFSFGKFFGSKDRAKSPAAAAPEKVEKPAESKLDATPKTEEAPTTVLAAAEPAPVERVEPVVPLADPTPVEAKTETKAEEAKAETKAEEAKKEETTSTPRKRGSLFGTLTRSLSKATGKKDRDAAKTAEKKEKLPETAEEPKTDVPAVADKPAEEAAAVAPVEKTIGDVPAEAVTIGEAKSTPAVATV